MLIIFYALLVALKSSRKGLVIWTATWAEETYLLLCILYTYFLLSDEGLMNVWCHILQIWRLLYEI